MSLNTLLDTNKAMKVNINVYRNNKMRSVNIDKHENGNKSYS